MAENKTTKRTNKNKESLIDLTQFSDTQIVELVRTMYLESQAISENVASLKEQIVSLEAKQINIHAAIQVAMNRLFPGNHPLGKISNPESYLRAIADSPKH